MVKSVKVHDDTHRVLKTMKEQMRGRSLDEVIRGMIRKTKGASVETLGELMERRTGATSELTSYIDPEKQK